MLLGRDVARLEVLLGRDAAGPEVLLGWDVARLEVLFGWDAARLGHCLAGVLFGWEAVAAASDRLAAAVVAVVCAQSGDGQGRLRTATADSSPGGAPAVARRSGPFHDPEDFALPGGVKSSGSST
ncbi:hypothetical protein GCM10010399_51830 [Dactylosporangium fulvum]